ncbi:MAG TPA: DUF4215 domain-containing protein [Kofleriaceae bacterium]|nr:DUF4215 domain-containing protein [Kofleriaceae bacterium]
MRDRSLSLHRSPRDRRRGALIAASVALHAGALLALLVSAAWRIDKLRTAEPPPVLVAGGIGAPLMPAEGDEPPPAAERKRERPRRVERTTQPGARTADEAAGEDGGGSPDGEASGDGAGAGGGGGGDSLSVLPCPPGQSCTLLEELPDPVCGNGQVELGEECDDGNRMSGDGCSARCAFDREVVVVARVIEGQRISGDPQIPAPEPVRLAMSRTGQQRAVGSIKMCLTASGAVRSLRVLTSTGYAEYDRLLLSRMRTWRYRPYRLDSGGAVPVCTVVTFIYRIE